MVATFKLEENSHIKDLFKLRAKWCPVYLRDTFFTDMTSTQRSESMNSFLNAYVNAQTSLTRFLECFEKAIDKREDTKKHAEMRDIHLPPVLRTGSPLERDAASILSRWAYERARRQLMQSSEYV